MDRHPVRKDYRQTPPTASRIFNKSFLVERAALRIGLRELQALQGDFVVVGRERSFLQKLLGLFGGFGGIAGEHALVEDFRRRQRRPVAEHDVEEFQPLDMASEHDEAHGQRRREHEADRPPQAVQNVAESDDGDRRQAVLRP